MPLFYNLDTPHRSSSTPRLRLPSTADMSDELVASCQVFLSKGVRPPFAFLDPDYSKAGIADYLFPTLKTTSPSPKSSVNDFPTTTYPQALVKWYEPAIASNNFSYAEASDLFIAVKHVQAAFSDAYYQRRTNDEDEQLVLLEAGLEDARPALTYLSDFWGNVRNCPLFAMITRGFVHQMIVDISSILTTEEKVNLLKGWGIPETELDHLQDYYSLSKQKFEVFPPIPLNPFDLEGACLVSLLDNPLSWFVFPGQDRLDYAPESTKPDERNEEVEGPDDDEVEVEKEAKSASPEVGHRVLRSVGKPAVRYSTSGHAKRPAFPSSEDSDSSTEVRKKPAKRQKPFVSLDDDVPLSKLVKSTSKATVDAPKANSAATRTVIRPLQRADRIRPVPPRNKTSVAASAPSTSKSSSKGKGKGKANKATSGSGAKQEYHPKSKFIKDVEGVSVVGDFLASDSFVPEETDLLGSRTQYTTGPDMLLRMPHFQIDKSLMALGGIVGRNGFNMSVGDIQRLAFPLPKPARMENGNQLGFCLECVRAGKDDCDYQRPQSRCRNCQTLKLQCSKTLDLEKGLDVMNVTLAHFRNAPEIAKDLRQALDLAVEGYTAQRKLIGFLSGQFLDAFNEFKATMDDPLIVLKSLAYSPEDPVARFSYDQFALLATIFKWNSKLNFSEVDTGDKTLLEWLEHVKSKASEPLPVASTSGGPSNTIADLFPSDKRTGDVEMEEQDNDGEGEDELAEGLATSVPIVGLEASLAGSPSSTVDSSLVPYLDLLVVPAELLTITPSYSAHVSDSEESEFDCTESSHAWDTIDKTYVHQRRADKPADWFDCYNQPCPNATESQSIQTERRTGKTKRLLIPISQIESFNQNPPTPSLSTTAPPPRFGRVSTPSSSRASPALIAPIPRRPVDTDIVISAVGQALIPTRAESVPEPLELVPIESIEFPEIWRRDEPIRVDTPPNPPIQPNPVMAQVTGQDVLRALNDLATNQAALQRVVTDVVTSMNNNKGVSKPHNYNGIGSEDACRFLAAFEVWAQGIPNLRALTGNEPVKSAISFLEGDAAIWATPIAENISAHTSNNNVPLTYPDWADFRAAFTARFETADPVTDAKNMLKALYQGKNSVAAYAATFKQYSERTGYSDTDLRDKFYDHLTDRVKDGLVHSQANTSLLANLITEATRIDNRINERFRQKTPFKAVTPATHSLQPINAPFIAHRDPNAMDVDATRTVTGKSSDDYRRFMTGRCYGCGSRNHRKADGHHERDVCDHCGLTGHLASV
ncbi:hypothetical protein D9757_010786 [Collybiopsis confluens]|uniref:Retrotransposon gag domain-containing protein n=1 Tax=Collybiopsis confluens TaxID=2823264 RepID=A0A8H5M2Z4_9AGAR|nr:hypothetical protein D9757_010786 [Collybiopsis confluens]